MDLLKSHIEDSELLTFASGLLEKLMPSFQEESLDTWSEKMKRLINSVDNNFQSFEKSAKEKAQNDFNARRIWTLKKVIIDYKVTLDTCAKGIQDALSEGGNI